MISRRHVLRNGAVLSVGSVFQGSLVGLLSGAPANAEAAERVEVREHGLVVANPNLCVGCRRCEAACGWSHDKGDVSPTLARVKVEQNMNFGPYGVHATHRNDSGQMGDRTIIPATCRQCDVCLEACREDAIYIDDATGARLIDEDKCVGCGRCTHACPKGVIAVDQSRNRAVKCDLCQGKPNCVEVCPTGAIQFYTWAEADAAIAQHEKFLRIS